MYRTDHPDCDCLMAKEKQVIPYSIQQKNCAILSVIHFLCLHSVEEKCFELGKSCRSCTSSIHGCSWCDGLCVKGNCPTIQVCTYFFFVLLYYGDEGKDFVL